MKRNLSRLLAAVIMIMMVASLMAGCGTAKDTGTPATSGEKAAVTEQPAETAAPLKEVTLRFYFGGEKKPAVDEVWNTLSEKYKDKLNAKFEINFIPFNDYTDKLMVMSSSGDNYDMNFDGNWLSYAKMINKGAYLPLNDLLPKYAPTLYADLNEKGVFAAATVSGKIMCVPWSMKMNQQHQFLIWRSDLLKKAGLNYAKDSVKTLEDLDKFLNDVKKAIPDVQTFGWDIGSSGPAVSIAMNRDGFYSIDFHTLCFDIKDAACKLIPTEQTKSYKEAAQYVKKWFDAGIIPKDLMVTKEQCSTAYRNGKIVAEVTTHEWAYNNVPFADSSWTQEISQFYPDNKVPNRSALANVMALNGKAANPERALMFLEMLNADKDFYDMVLYGIKDKTYVLDGEKASIPAGMNPQTTNYLDWQGQWALWKPQFMRPTDLYPAGFWQKEAEFASSPAGMANPIDGLFIDSEPIKNEISKRDQVESELGKLIQYGAVNDVGKSLDEYIQKQKDVGLDKILVEVQKQVDAFLAAKK
jgi:putative aldouronate transport system substrate-binding protein